MSADITKPGKWYSLKLGEIASIESYGILFSIERVPGGWLYWYEEKATFIPFSDEFEVSRGQLESDLILAEQAANGCKNGISIWHGDEYAVANYKKELKKL